MKSYYRIELHAHTKETSPCAEVPAAELVERYLAKGYDGIVITDHMNPDFLWQFAPTYDRSVTLACDWNMIVDRFLAGYRAVKEAAGDRMKVYLGMEIRCDEARNDYLVYGFDEAFLRDHPFLLYQHILPFHELCQKNDIAVFQAHPYRFELMLPKNWWIDGIEIYNNNPRHDSHNEMAALWCKKLGLPAISGSDFHQPGDEGRGGILLPYLPEDDKALARALFDEENKILLQCD